MPRNVEIVRQWSLLRSIEAARSGLSVLQLTELSGVTRRTVYRDLDALQEVGFPLTNELRDGRSIWMLGAPPFKRIDQLGFSLSELCALYLSRRMIDVIMGVPFQAPLESLFGRFEQEMPPKMRQYLDQLPSALATVPTEPRVKRSPNYDAHVAALLQATLDHREVQMVYHSNLHERVKTYVIQPYRIVYAHGGLYLFAFVPEYDQIRTFAMQRVRRVKTLSAKFTPSHDLPANPFAASLGPNQGEPAVHVALRFSPRLAPAIRERVYHPSQKVEDLPDRSLRMTLEVCDDAWLHTWILGFGRLVTVEAPETLVNTIVAELEQTRGQYTQTALDDGPVTPTMMDWGLQGRLPFAGC
jgi:predicted DNA-binding transcriptional regulator YafY